MSDDDQAPGLPVPWERGRTIVDRRDGRPPPVLQGRVQIVTGLMPPARDTRTPHTFTVKGVLHSGCGEVFTGLPLGNTYSTSKLVRLRQRSPTCRCAFTYNSQHFKHVGG